MLTDDERAALHALLTSRTLKPLAYNGILKLLLKCSACHAEHAGGADCPACLAAASHTRSADCALRPAAAPTPDFERYADLLRAAWLNTSDKDFQAAVHEFEYEHYEQLKPYFRKWRDAWAAEDKS